MTTATETDVTRSAAYPFISDKAWWQLRKQFQAKGFPKIFDANYIIVLDIRTNEASANNIVRPFKRFGFFREDGKPEPLVWDWIEDSKYAEVCDSILHKVYPEELTSLFTTTSEEDQRNVERWFQRTEGLAPGSARQYATFYMLLLRADPKEQEAANGAPSGRSPKAITRPIGTTKPRPSATKAQAVQNILPMTPVPEPQSTQEGTHSQAPRAHHTRGAVEPTLNINVQIHIPAEATAEQIEQIFRSMAKHLYQRPDEADA